MSHRAWWWKRPYCAIAGHLPGSGGYVTVSWYSADLGRTVRYRKSTCWRCGVRYRIGLHQSVQMRKHAA